MSLMAASSTATRYTLQVPPGVQPGPVIRPQDGPQVAALSSKVTELLYGGGVFGGKTWYLCLDPLGIQYQNTPLGKAAIQVPRYRAVLFRRKSTEFMQLIDQTREFYPHWGGRFIFGRRGDPGPSWTFPSGARIFICHMESESNKHDHDSSEYQYVGFDQVEQFTLTQYLHLMSRLRTVDKDLFVRLRATANPIGAGLKWVRARFVKGTEPYAERYMLPDDDPAKNPAGRDITAKVLAGKATAEERRDMISRVYIPASYTDNPLGMQRDPTYPGRVKALGKKHERALLFNDWDAFSGNFFTEFDPAGSSGAPMLVQPFDIPRTWRLVGSFDPGWSSPCSFSLGAVNAKGEHYRLFTYYAVAGMRQNVDGIVQMIRTFKWTNGRMPEEVFSGWDAFPQETKKVIHGEEVFYRDLFRAQGIELQRAARERETGWGAIRDLMERRLWFVFDRYNEPFIDELLAADHDELNPNDIRGRGNDPEVADHALDEERYRIMATWKPTSKKPTEGGWVGEMRSRAKTGGGWEPGTG
jgi:hypothetical protein